MRTPKKLLLIVLSFLLVFTGLPVQVFAGVGMNELRTSTLPLNDQLTLYNGMYYHTASAGKLAENYMVYAPGTIITPMVAYGNDIHGAASVARIYELEEAAGNSIVAMSNGDYFTMATGVSIGTVIKDGIIRASEHNTFETVGFWADGSAKLGRPNVSINFTNEMTGGVFTKVNFNKTLTKEAGVVLYSKDFGDTHEANLPSKNVVIDIHTGQASPNGTIQGEIAYIADATGKLALSDTQLVVSVAAQTPYSSVLTMMGAMQAGDPIKVEFGIGKGWENVYNAVGVERRLVSGQAVQSFTDTTKAPRTAIGIKADGNIVLYTVDGRRSQYSIGMTYAELATRMKELGCVDAVNLDGGDSTMLFATYPGYESKQQVNKNSGSTLRRCGNYILFKNNNTPTTTIKHIHVYPYSQTILSGATVQMETKASDANYFYVKAPSGGVNYSVSTSNLGTVTADGLFTAGGKDASGTISAKYNGITGSSAMTVVSSPDNIALISPESGIELPDKMAISAGESFAFSAAAMYKMLPIVSDDAAYRWSLKGDIGTLDEKGVFTATTLGLGTGTITATAGNKSDSIDVTIVTEGKLLENFEGESPLHFRVGTFGNLKAEIETALPYVHNGKQSLKLQYTHESSEVEVATDGGIDLPLQDHALPVNIDFFPKSPTMLSAWVYGDNSENKLQLRVTTIEGTQSTVDRTLDFSGWKHVDFQLPKGVRKLDAVAIVTGKQSAGTDTLYIDQLMAGFGYYVDYEAPTIDADAASGVLIGSVTDNLDSEIVKAQIHVTYDGKALAFDYNEASKSLSALLPDGDGLLHRVVVKAVDLSGNIARVGVTVSTKSADPDFEKQKIFTDMPEKHWATQYAEYLYHQNIITGSISKDKRIYTPDKTMTRQEFAAVAVRWLGVDTTKYADVELPFTDVSKIQDWAKDSVRAALQLGLMAGRSAGGTKKLTFDPTGPISRQEVMAVIGRVQEKGYAEAQTDFKDANKIANWALPYVKTLVAQGVISGYNNRLDPTGSVTRAQVAKIIFELN